MNALGPELRFAARMSIRNPGLSLAIILTLALGIGANTAIFSASHAVALKPLPYQEPERLVALWESVPLQQVTHNVVSSGNYLDWRDRNEVFESIGAYSGMYPVALSAADRPELVAAVTAMLKCTAKMLPSLPPIACGIACGWMTLGERK